MNGTCIHAKNEQLPFCPFIYLPHCIYLLPEWKRICHLKYFHRNYSTRLGIGQSIVVPHEVIAASGSDCLQLMVLKGATEVGTGGCQGIIEGVIRIIHLIYPDAALRHPSSKRALWATKGSPSIFGAICFHTSEKTGALQVSSSQRPCT